MDAKMRQLHELSYLLPPRLETLIGGSSPITAPSDTDLRSGSVPLVPVRNTRGRTLLRSFATWTRVLTASSDDHTHTESKLW